MDTAVQIRCANTNLYSCLCHVGDVKMAWVHSVSEAGGECGVTQWERPGGELGSFSWREATRVRGDHMLAE